MFRLDGYVPYLFYPVKSGLKWAVAARLD